MSEPDIQALVDGVAAELRAPVALDVDLRIVAYTAHGDLIDEVRRSVILDRRVPQDVRAWYEQWGIREAHGPVRTPANKRLGALERWCIPVRFRGTRLGYVWVLDAGAVEEGELAPAVEAAEHIGALLYRQRLSAQADAHLLRLLLIPSPESESVAAEARALDAYADKTAPVAVLIAGGVAADDLTPAALNDLALAVQRAAENVVFQGLLTGIVSGLGVALVPLREDRDMAPARRLAEKVHRFAEYINGDLGLIVALGGAIELERTNVSYAQARRALRMARAMRDLGEIVSWDDLGVLRALSHLPVDEIESGVLDPRVRALLTDAGLAATAETFLDLAGNVQETAAVLYIHRTTLYQRLDRIAAVYKLDLRHNGDHRLLTHLGLKLMRIASP